MLVTSASDWLGVLSVKFCYLPGGKVAYVGFSVGV